MKSYSQAGQDIFVRRLLGDSYVGSFLDIGCGSEQYSNTLALEQSGWVGVCVDINPKAGEGRRGFICEDATRRCAWMNALPNEIDYLSLDIDGGSANSLIALPLDSTRFRIITIEHDAYRFQDSLRANERVLLSMHDYRLICSNVMNDGLPFEDWWVCSELEEAAEPFRSHNKDWREILK